MPESEIYYCDCPLATVVEDGDEAKVTKVAPIAHRESCPLYAKELPPLGVCVSDTSGVVGKVGK